MNSIYRFASQESLRQDIYLTQGVNENYGAFACRVSGLQVNFPEPDTFLRRSDSWSSDCSQGSFKAHFDYASTSEAHYSLPGEGVCAAQRYFFYLRTEAPKEASLYRKDHADKNVIAQPDRHRHYLEMSDKPDKTVFQRLLNFFTRCFMPCINVNT